MPQRRTRILVLAIGGATVVAWLAFSHYSEQHNVPPTPGPSNARTYTFEVLADYRQFYLEDASEPYAPIPNFNQAIRDLIGAGPDKIYVGTAGESFKTVTVEVAEVGPAEAEDLGAWDHVTEASIAFPSGRAYISSVGNPHADQPIEVQPSTYRARVYYGNMLSAFEPDATGKLAWRYDGEDHYLIRLWPADSAAPVRVLKRWERIDLLGYE